MEKNKLPIIIKIILLIVILSGAFLRFYKPDWDQGYYLHPDERLYVNASNIKLPKTINEFFSPNSSLNPHMFYYGEFPLMVYVFFNRLIGDSTSFLYLSRMISAILSTISIGLIFLSAAFFLPPVIALFAAILFAFSPSLIQHAHFITTETWLVFFACLLTYLSFRFYFAKNKIILAFVLGMISGLCYATKITGLTFSLIPFAAYLLIFLKDIKKHPILNIRKTALLAFLFLISLSIFGFLGAPYNIIDYKSFKTEQDYMQGVTYGKFKPPFIIIYENTPSYIYQLTKILPFYVTPLILILGICGLIFLIIDFFKKSKKEYLIILIFPLFYFIWSGNWYAKFARYQTILIPFICLFSAYLVFYIKKLPRIIKWVIYLFILYSLIMEVFYGISFFKIYLYPNTRVEATNWIYQNIPTGSVIATEHWDDPLPLPEADKSPNQLYNLQSLLVYEPDSPNKIDLMLKTVSSADYLIFSSRRVNASIIKNPALYPFTSLFYKNLFQEKLGFVLERKFTRYPKLFGIENNDNNADETIQSYDHPPVYIFKNTGYFTNDKLMQLITPN